MLWKQAAFYGIEIVTYAMMADHFHVLAWVPEPVELSDGQLLERLQAFYGCGLAGSDGTTPAQAFHDGTAIVRTPFPDVPGCASSSGKGSEPPRRGRAERAQAASRADFRESLLRRPRNRQRLPP